jgi:hypothetical protein
MLKGHGKFVQLYYINMGYQIGSEEQKVEHNSLFQ